MNIVIGCALVIVTTVIHAGFMVGALEGLKVIHARKAARKLWWMRSLIVAMLVVIMFVASVVESMVWAAAYLAVGAFSEGEQALYFSMVTYTTLGYGDVVVEGQWRLLATFEAASGIIMFGWSTALIFVAVQRLYFAEAAHRTPHG